jgi:hypothetical protein
LTSPQSRRKAKEQIALAQAAEAELEAAGAEAELEAAGGDRVAFRGIAGGDVG